jgi:peptidoglycan-N-acetylglucosamine deacetylase
MDTFLEPLSRTRPISSSHKILCIAAVAMAALTPASVAPPTASATPPQPLRAELSQAGRSLIFSLRTSKPVALAELDRLPQAKGSHYLCLELQRVGRSGTRRLCLGGAGKARRQVGLELIGGAGKETGEDMLVATVKRPDARKLVLALLPGDAGLAPHRYRWRVIADLGGCGKKAGKNCEASLPNKGARVFRLRPVRAVGCTGGDTGLDTSGPRDRSVVALTFDDGPSDYTPAFLDVLRDKHVDGTFFEVGQEMPGRESTMRRILREGSEIGNHTTHHTELPGFADIAPTSALIHSATHFEPCLFRPPGGAVNPSVLSAAGEDGLRTITWDVDPGDWMNPGSGAVYSRIVDAAQPGSIILMHDGGGDRSGTLAALPAIIDTLRARDYRFVTVSELLGQRLIYKPYG